MTWLHVLLARVKGLFAKEKQDRELSEELRAHLEMLAADKQRQGMTPEEAHRVAHQHFGGIAQTEENYRAVRGVHFVETMLQDIRYALRVLRRNPGFAAVIVVSLALGIGANTAIFSAINAVMLRMLPVKDPQQLVMLQWHAKTWPDELVQDLEGNSYKDENSGLYSSYSFNYAGYMQLRDHNHVFASTLAFAANSDEVNVGVDGHAEAAVIQAVSGNYFETLGVQAIVGRTLLSQDDGESAPPVAVVSHGFWQQRLGASSSVTGKSVVINGTHYTIVGVAPPEFFGLEPGDNPDFYITLAQDSAAQMRLGNFSNGLPFLKDPKTWWVGIVGRLKPGTTQAEAQAELAVLFHQSIYTDAVAANSPDVPALDAVPVKNGLDSLRRKFSTSLLLLMGMVGLVLLIACGNVASLLLTRAAARQREIAVRLSLGARRFRLIRQLLTESVILALAGGLAGLFVAKWASSVLLKLLSSGRYPVDIEMHMDLRVLAFTAAVSILSGIVFGLVPALRATRMELLTALKHGGVGASGRRLTAGKLLVGGQVALCLVLLVSAGLFLGTLSKLEGLQVGFDQHNLLLFTVRPGLNGYQNTQVASYYQELQRRVQSIPGVRSVTFSDRAPIGQGSGISDGMIPGYTAPGKRVHMWRHLVGPDYFSTLGIGVLQGRGIGPEDGPSALKVIVVNQEFAQKYFHGDNPLGRQIDFGDSKHKAEYEVVGVVQDVKYAQLREDVPPTIYLSYLQRPNVTGWMTYEVRGSGADVAPLVAAVRREAETLDKDVPLVNVKTETQAVDQVLFMERTFAALSSSFGFLAVLLACVGLYGTMAYAVARRTNEIGIRMALGAGRGSILALVLRETLIIVVGGLLVGVPAAWASSKLLESQLFGLSPHDPVTLVFATLTLLAVSLLAGYLPARRASKVDPMVALRYE